MADKEILDTADLEDQILTTKKYLTTNRKIWVNTIVNSIAMSIL